jgi:hypothetical protein
LTPSAGLLDGLKASGSSRLARRAAILAAAVTLLPVKSHTKSPVSLTTVTLNMVVPAGTLASIPEGLSAVEAAPLMDAG